MTDRPGIPWRRVIIESSAIVGSILLAFAIDAAWDQSGDRAKERTYLEALRIDLSTTAENLARSIHSARRGSEAGEQLLAATLASSAPPPSDSILWWLGAVGSYEVFAPATGAYQAIVNSGDFGVIRDPELRLALASFYGGFDDTRATEQILLARIVEFTQTPEYVRHFNRGLRGRGDELTTSATDIAADPIFLNWLGSLSNSHTNLLEDYRRLEEGLVSLRALAEEPSG